MLRHVQHYNLREVSSTVEHSKNHAESQTQQLLGKAKGQRMHLLTLSSLHDTNNAASFLYNFTLFIHILTKMSQFGSRVVIILVRI